MPASDLQMPSLTWRLSTLDMRTADSSKWPPSNFKTSRLLLPDYCQYEHWYYWKHGENKPEKKTYGHAIINGQTPSQSLSIIMYKQSKKNRHRDIGYIYRSQMLKQQILSTQRVLETPGTVIGWASRQCPAAFCHRSYSKLHLEKKEQVTCTAETRTLLPFHLLLLTKG